ncbi:E3 ubiquitin-protein ligase ipaH3 [compost metagenome]
MSTEQAVDVTAEHTRHVENLKIVQRALPQWLTKASVDIRQAYSRSLAASHTASRAANTVLSKLEGLDDFAAKQLTEAVEEKFKIKLDVRSAIFKIFFERNYEYIGYQKIHFFRLHSQGSLLHVALKNSSAASDSPTYMRGAGVYIGKRYVKKIDPVAFVSLVRTLDVGGKYQNKLHAVFTPDADDQGVPGPRTQAIVAKLASARRYKLEVAAHTAYMKGRVDWQAYQVLLQVCENPSDTVFGSTNVECRKVTLFEHELCAILIFQRDPSSTKRVLYLPDDPVDELYEFESLAALTQSLRERLKNEKLREYLIKHAPIAEQVGLKQRLQREFSFEEGAELGREHLFNELVRQQTLRIAEDSRFLAVPTADMDDALQQRIAKLQSVGFLLVNLASFVVPVLNQLMLVAATKQLMSEVYQGVEDWSEGRNDEALGHLTSAIETLGVAAVAGVVGYRVNLWVNKSEFFQSLRAVKLFNGTVKLRSPDLAPYRRSVDLTDATDLVDGRYQLDNEHYITIDEHHYLIELDDALGKWRVIHPSRYEEVPPLLLSNGRGAWRFEYEAPWQWPSVRYLFRRLGGVARGLDDQGVDEVLAVSGVDDALLCRVHVDQAHIPARLAVALKRWQLEQDIDRFIELLRKSQQVSDEAMSLYLQPGLSEVVPAEDAEPAVKVRWAQAMADAASTNRADLFEHCVSLHDPEPAPETALILKDFPGLPQEMAEEVIEQASDAQLARMAKEERVPLALAEQARWHLRDFHLMRALEGFYQPYRAELHFEKLALGLIEHLPDWTSGTYVERVDVGPTGKLIAKGGKGEVVKTMRILEEEQSGYELFDSEGKSKGKYSNLFEVLSAVDGQMTAADLQSQLSALAIADRPRASALVSKGEGQPWFRMPARMHDKRLGYPMGGTGAVGKHSGFYLQAFKTLYPRMTNQEISAHLDQLTASGLNLRLLLDEKNQELQTLQETLVEWVSWEENVPGQGRMAGRRRIADTLEAAWRRQGARMFNVRGELIGYRVDLQGADLRQLPVFPGEIDFSHVLQLSLRNTGLTDVPTGFLEAFSKLKILDLGANQLTELPRMVGDMGALEELNCESNAIVLSAQTAQAISSLRRLEHLKLNGNPIGLVPDVHLMRGLRILELRNTGISSLPVGLLQLSRLELVDLRENQLRELEADVYKSTGRQVRSLLLQDNPFTPETLAQIGSYQERTGVNLGRLADSMMDETRPELFWGSNPDPIETQLREKQWFALRREPDSLEFFRLLNALVATSDYEKAHEDLVSRVWGVIDAACSSSALREEVFKVAGDGRTCGDNIANIFSIVEVEVESFKARALGNTAHAKGRLLELAKGLFRLEKLAVFVELEVKALGGEALREAVEYSLAYRTRLASKWGLPGQPKHMLFPDLPRVTEDDIKRAEKAIVDAERNGDALAQFVVEQGFWSDWLRKQYADDFEQLRINMESEEQALDARNFDSKSPEYEEEYKKISRAYLKQETAWLLRKTKTLLAEHQAGGSLARNDSST